MKVLLSVKPEYAERIFSGEKQFEFRKCRFKKNISTVVVYVSSPIRRIVGEFEVDAVLEGPPSRLWQETADKAGISKKLFFEYFLGKKIGIAIKIGKKEKYKRAINPYDSDKKFCPPQSFRYM